MGKVRLVQVELHLRLQGQGELRQGARLVLTHEPAVADDVGSQDRRNLTMPSSELNSEFPQLLPICYLNKIRLSQLSAKPLYFMVLGAGFEPATFRL